MYSMFDNNIKTLDDEIISFKLLNEKLVTYNWVTITGQQFSSFVDVRILCKII